MPEDSGPHCPAAGRAASDRNQISRGFAGTWLAWQPLVPSTQHEILVELFRNRGELATELIRIREGVEFDHARVERGSIDLSQVTSTEYRADSVILLQDLGGKNLGAVVVEVQLGVDVDKLYSWPLYVSALRAQRRCPTRLLVITSDAAVARWASTPIELGHPGFRLAPIVVGFEHVPRIIDPLAAQKLPELAVLSVMAHPELEVALAAVDAIQGLPGDQNQLYLDVILARLPDAVRRALERKMIKGYEYQSEFARKYYSQGREEGREEGRKRGREEGRKQGREEGMRAAALALARAKLVALSAADEAAIAALHDRSALSALITELGRARSAARARAALDRAIAAR